MTDLSLSWSPEYSGIDYANQINQGWVGGAPNNLKNINFLRIDLADPKIGFLVSPFAFLNKAGNQTTAFLANCFNTATMNAVYAINGNFFEFAVPEKRDLFFGVAVSEGNILSYPSLTAPCTLYINQRNAAVIATCGSAIDAFTLQQGHVQPWTAVSGNCVLVTNGVSTAPLPSSPLSKSPIAARTAIGLSAPTIPGGTPQYLYLLTIDGVDQPYVTPPYYGATLQDVADWMIAAGAYNAIGLDGGGSTTMASAVSPAVGEPPAVSLINSPHDTELETSVCERSVAVSFGVAALW